MTVGAYGRVLLVRSNVSCPVASELSTVVLLQLLHYFYTPQHCLSVAGEKQRIRLLYSVVGAVVTVLMLVVISSE